MRASQWLPEMAMWVRSDLILRMYKDLGARLRSGKVGGIDSQDESTGTAGTGREWSISSRSFGTFGAIIPLLFCFFSFLSQVDSLSSLLIWILKSHHHRHRHRHRHHASYYQTSETTVGGQPCHHPSARTAFDVLSQPYWWFPSDTGRGPVALSLLRL